MLAHDVPFDACQLPLNVFDGTYRSFEQEVLPVLTQRHIAPLAMKSINGNAESIKQGLVTVEEALRYVLSLRSSRWRTASIHGRSCSRISVSCGASRR